MLRQPYLTSTLKNASISIENLQNRIWVGEQLNKIDQGLFKPFDLTYIIEYT